MKISEIKLNSTNPRFIKDDKFKKLVKSISEFPKMLELRPIIYDPETKEIIGGNMRYRALIELKYKEIPNEWVKSASDLTDEEKQRFIIEDNVGFGEWDWDILANEWDCGKLQEWGLDLPLTEDAMKEEPESEEKVLWTPDCLFPSNNIYDIPTLLLEQQPTELYLPFKPYGADSRDKKVPGTYHFYVDDYRFEAIWDNPRNIVNSDCIAVVEPNLSLFDTTPLSYGLYLIYKKRWIARYFQSFDIKVFADLNVSKKFADYNKLGIPEGYNAFCTRAYADRLESLESEIQIAREISGLDNPLFIVYGGGLKAKEISSKNNCIFVEQFMNKGGK